MHAVHPLLMIRVSNSIATLTRARAAWIGNVEFEDQAAAHELSRRTAGAQKAASSQLRGPRARAALSV